MDSRLPLTGKNFALFVAGKPRVVVAFVVGEIRAHLEVIRKVVAEPDQETGAALELGRGAAIEVRVGIENW